MATTVGEPDLRWVAVGGREVLLARMPSGEVAAFATHCPHQGTPLLHATIFEGSLRCPQHNYVYDLRTGRNLLPTRHARPEALSKLRPGYLPIHRAEERDGWIWVEDSPNPEPAHDEGSNLERATVPVRRRPVAAEPPPRPVECGAERMEARLGEDVILLLPTSVAPGHIWHIETSGARLAVLGESYEPGQPPGYRVRLRPIETGQATVRCTYRKPWGGPAREIRTFELVVAAASRR